MAEKLASGHTVEELKGKEEGGVKDRFFLYSDGVVKLQPGGWVLPKNFIKYANKLHNFEVRSSDIFVTAFPKSGTTWVQEIVWNLVENPNLDNPKANICLDQRFQTLEGDMYIATTGVPPPDADGIPMKTYQMLYPGKSYLEGFVLGLTAHAPSPRFIKSHLPVSLLPSKTLETAKIIHIIREPRDVLTSYYHYARLQILMGYEGSLDEFIEDCVNDRIPYAPYWNSFEEALNNKDHPNFCLVFYEDLKSDPLQEVKKIDKFLGTNRSDKEIDNIIEFASFGKMKDRFKDKQPTSHSNILFEKDVEEKEGGFFRKGKVGDWKNRFTPEQTKKVNRWIEKNTHKFGENCKYKV